MYLSKAELELLCVHSAGHLAQRRLARGVKLNLSEAVSLLTSQCLEFIRDGQEDIEKLEADVRRLLGFRQVLPGVPELIREVALEAHFSDGPRLVKVTDPICAPDGDLELALRGSFLPVPAYEVFGAINDDDASTSVIPGNVIVRDQEPIELNADASATCFLTVTNTSDVPITVGSHYHFIEANKALQFDRSLAFGMRLNIPAGETVTFSPGETKEVPLVQIGGQRIIRGGNLICDGLVEESLQRKTMKNVKKRGFAHRKDDNACDDRCATTHLPRELYVQNYGPTTGDRVVLGDTCLVIEIERDLTTYGDECVHGVGRVLREGMGQTANVRNDIALDLVIAGAVVIDPVLGVLKADIGVRDGLIQNVGKAGNPHTMSGVSAGLIVGVGTDVLPAHGLLVTPGTFIPGLVVSNPADLSEMILTNGLTSAFVSGASGSAKGVTAGPNAVKQALQSLDDTPINTGVLVKANTSKGEGLAKEIEDTLVAGAGGMTVGESWGCTSAAVDTALRIADYHDVPLFTALDRLRECYNPAEFLSLSRQRLAILPYSKFLSTDVMKHPSVILTACPRYSQEPDEEYSLDRLAEEVLHDVGAISFMSSKCCDDVRFSCEREYVKSVWQIAHRMKALRGPLPEETTDSDNFRVMRFLAKYTVNPAIAFGCEHAVGTLQNFRLADMTIWEPGYFGVRPKYVIKGGQIIAMEVGADGTLARNGSHPACIRKSMGSAGKSPAANSLIFTSKAAMEVGMLNTYAIQKHQSVIRNCRCYNRTAMILNSTSPKLTIDEPMGKIYIDVPGRRETFSASDLTRVSSDLNPLSQRYQLL